MKKLLLSLLVNALAIAGFAQTDKMLKHTGETLEIKVIKVGENVIIYKFPGEDAEQTIGKLAVANITYSSGRKEDISEKIVVSGKSDWEKVQVLTDASQVVGLKKAKK